MSKKKSKQRKREASLNRLEVGLERLKELKVMHSERLIKLDEKIALQKGKIEQKKLEAEAEDA